MGKSSNLANLLSGTGKIDSEDIEVGVTVSNGYVSSTFSSNTYLQAQGYGTGNVANNYLQAQGYGTGDVSNNYLNTTLSTKVDEAHTGNVSIIGNVGIGGSNNTSKFYINDSSSSYLQSGLYVDRSITDITQDNQYGARLVTNVYGSSTLDADYKYSYGIYNYSHNYANGFNDTTDRNLQYGIYNQTIVDSSSTVRDNNAIYSRADQYSTTTSIKKNNKGVHGEAQNWAGSLTSQHGLYGFSGVREQSTVTNSHGVYGESQIYSSGGTINTAYGGYFVIDNYSPDTVTYPGATSTMATVYGVRSYINNRTGSTITGSSFAYRGTFTGSGTYSTKYGVYISGETSNRGDVGWTTGSDIRIKENVENITDAVDKVKQIRGVTYNRIGNDVREAGVIAQELEVVLPEAVVEFDPDPEDDDDRTLKGVTYDRITALLIEAIKEQQTTIEALEARLAALESGA